MPTRLAPFAPYDQGWVFGGECLGVSVWGSVCGVEFLGVRVWGFGVEGIAPDLPSRRKPTRSASP